MTKEVAGVRYASVISLSGDLERDLHETVRVQPGLPWSPQNVEDKTVVRYLLKNSNKREQKHPKRQQHIAVQQSSKELKI